MANINLYAGNHIYKNICNNESVNMAVEKELYKKIVAVTNRRLCDRELLIQIELLCKKQVSSVILREKDMTEKEYKVMAEKAVSIGRTYNTPIIIHTFVNVAESINNMAIHLSMPEFMKITKNDRDSYKTLRSRFKIIGVSTHTLEEALEAEKAGATYITASHIYETDCKKGLEPKGIDYLKEVCKTVSIPVYALGGINYKNMHKALESGAEKVCMMSEMMRIK